LDIKEYIASGILEGYTLGILSQQEMKEVECMSHIYPEIETELRAIQKRFEELAIENSVDVPVEMESKIFEAIKNTTQDQGFEAKPAVTKTKVVKFSPIKTLAYAASVVMVLGALGVLFLKQIQLKANYQKELSALNKQNQQLDLAKTKSADSLLKIQSVADGYANQLKFIADTNTKKVILAGTNGHQNNQSIVYWNVATKKVYLQTNNLPVPESNLQFQLWALVDGKPVDLGVFDIDRNVNLALKQMIDIPKADAFAITLETKGGNPSPNLAQLYVMGAI
jgi:anti-sigma-K factor RskA